MAIGHPSLSVGGALAFSRLRSRAANGSLIFFPGRFGFAEDRTSQYHHCDEKRRHGSEDKTYIVGCTLVDRQKRLSGSGCRCKASPPR